MNSQASIQSSTSSIARLSSRFARPAVAIGVLIAGMNLGSCGQAVDANPVQAQSSVQSTPTAPANSGIDANQTSELAYWQLWQCNAYPVNGMPFTYWIHANAAVAARSAMNACWRTYYVPCNYNCFRVR